MAQMQQIIPLSVFFADNENKGEAYGKWIKYITQLCVAYGIVDVGQCKAMIMVHGGEDIAVLEITDYIPPQATPLRVETMAELATRIGLNFPVRATPYLAFFKLYETKQREQESIRDFTNRLQRQVRKCTFTNLATVAAQQDQMVINCVVVNTNNEKLKRQMLNLNIAATLDGVLEMGAGLESVAVQLAELAKAKETAQISRIFTQDKQRANSFSSSAQSSASLSSKPRCENCGNFHNNNDYCAATKVQCFNCENFGHFKQYCKGQRKVKPIQKSHSSNSITPQVTQSQSQINQQYQQYNQQQNQYKQQQNRPTYQHRPPSHQNLITTFTNTPDEQHETKHENDQLFQDYANGMYQQSNQFMIKVKDQSIDPSIKSSTGTYEINGQSTRGTLDTGSGRTCQTIDCYKAMVNRPELHDYNGVAYGFGSNVPISVIGSYTGTVTSKLYNDQSWKTEVLVVPFGENVLDNVTCQKLKLITIVNQLSVTDKVEPVDKPPPQSINTKSSTIYDGETINRTVYRQQIQSKHPKLYRPNSIGKFNGYQARIYSNPDIQPVQNKIDRTPIFIRPVVNQEIKEMHSLDLIEKLPPGTPTTWIVPIRVVPKKTGSGWRVTLNMVKPNMAILRQRTMSLTIDDVRLKVQGAKWITKFDLNKAYQQIEVHEQDRHLMTFSTYEGLYRSKRLFWGCASASDIFENVISHVLDGFPFACNISDDVLTWGNDDTHDKNAEEVMKRFEKAGMTFGLDKCIFKQRQVEFFGRMISGFGIWPTDENIIALKEAQRPQTLEQVKTFLGVVQWNNAFVQQLSTISAPLATLSNSKKYEWTSEHETTFQKLKDCLTNKPLKHFNKEWYTKLVVDASPIGLGCILIQIDPTTGEVWVCFYGSRKTNRVESNYSQIEREVLACKWSLIKYKSYLLGRKFTLVTDNKPVMQMFSNPNAQITNERIQRMMDKIPKYEMNVEYIKGELNPADFFSRNPLKPTKKEQEIIDHESASIEKQIMRIVTDATPPSLQHQQIATAKCEVLQEVIRTINNNYNIDNLSPTVRPFKDVLDQMVMFQGVLCVQNKMVIPVSMQTQLIKTAHFGHSGIKRTYELLKLNAWFVNMKQLVTELITKCIFQVWTKRGVRTTVFMTETPPGPNHTAACDYKGPLANGNLLFIYICVYSRYPIVIEVSSTSFIQLKKALDNIFGMFGNPVKLISDNGPPFTSYEMEEYCKSRGIYHQMVTPLWPNANGLAEKFIKNLVKVIEISKIENKPISDILPGYLMNYRATPHCTTNASPSKMFFNREMRTMLPSLNIIKQNNENWQNVAELNNKYNNQKIASYADIVKHSKADHKLKEKDIVRIIIKQNAFKANRFSPELFTIIEIRGSAIAVASTVDGRKYVRNCSHVTFVSRPCHANNNNLTNTIQNNQTLNQATIRLPLNPVLIPVVQPQPMTPPITPLLHNFIFNNVQPPPQLPQQPTQAMATPLQIQNQINNHDEQNENTSSDNEEYEDANNRETTSPTNLQKHKQNDLKRRSLSSSSTKGKVLNKLDPGDELVEDSDYKRPKRQTVAPDRLTITSFTKASKSYVSKNN
jgi:hypothetical protein